MRQDIVVGPADTTRMPPTRWLALGGVIAPPMFVALYTLAGFLRPGYSPVHQAVSDLGVGVNGWLVNSGDIVCGLLLVGCALGFAMYPHFAPDGRWLIAVLLALHGLGLAMAGVFTEAPATLPIHILAAFLGLVGPIVAFLIIGFLFRRHSLWRRWGNRFLIASLTTLILIVILFWGYTPGTPLAIWQLGGGLERVTLLEIQAWYVGLGWWLFVSASSRNRQ